MSSRSLADSPTAATVFAGPGETRALLRATDWSATPLGAVSGWPPELLAAIRTVLNSRLPVLLFWGPQLVQIYNDACLPNLGDKHPRSVAQPAAECWSEDWDALRPAVEMIMSGREPSLRRDDQLLFFARDGHLEETYQTYSFSAITDGSGAVLGIFVNNSDAVTARVIGERRLRTLRELGSVSTVGAGGAAEACRAILDIIAHNRADVPFGSIHLLDDAGEPRLVAAFGFREPTSQAEPVAEPEALTRLRRTITRNEPQLVTGLREQFAGCYDPTGALGDEEPDSSMMLPLTEHGRSRRLGVLVLGISPYLIFDADYRAFLLLVGDQVSIAVTDAVAYQAERSRAEALADLDAAKTRFFENISHEIRTPLTLLLGPLQQVLADPEVSLGGHREDLEAARRATLRLRRLVDGLLEVARGEVDRIQPAAESTDLGALTAECASMFRSVVEGAGLRLEVHTPTDSRRVPVDRQMWAHIVLNLLSNAVKFTGAGAIEVNLEITEEEATLQVVDTGAGIPAEDLPLIFDRFHQVARQPARSREGAGIGLSLVSDLVHAHGGSVAVTSTLGSGSTFTVRIPSAPHDQAAPRPLEPPTDIAAMFLADAAQWRPAGEGQPAGDQPTGDDRPAADEEQSTRPALGRTPAGSGSSTALSLQVAPRLSSGAGQLPGNGTVLVVDDNADMRGFLSRLLTQDGWNVTAVGTVDAALRHQVTPDLVLADVMLPDRDGLDLLRVLQASPGADRIPIVLLTARAGPESIVEGLNLGAADYLVKPFEPIELLARVRAIVELQRRRESALAEAVDRANNLEEALSTNRRIGTAVGIVMSQRNISSDKAFDLLSRVSQANHRKLREIADEVTLSGQLPGD